MYVKIGMLDMTRLSNMSWIKREREKKKREKEILYTYIKEILYTR